MEHHFNIEIAQEYGLVEAIILNNLWFWVKKNEANETHFHDGEYWTYNSIKAMEILHPYLTEKKIRNAINHLKNEGIIIIGNYNKSPYDRTAWYAFTQKGKSIMPKGQIEVTEKANGSEQKGEPIPYKNPSSKNKDKNNTNYLDEFALLWDMYPRKEGHKNAYKAYEKARKSGTTYEEVETGIRLYLCYIEDNKIERRFIKMGSTWFNQNSWTDQYVNEEDDLLKGIV